MKLSINDETLNFEVDTGSPISAISRHIFDNSRLLSKLELHKTPRVFKTFHEKCIVPCGVLNVHVIHRNKNYALELFVLPGENETPIIGRQWLRTLDLIQFDPNKNDILIHSLSVKPVSIESLVFKFKEVFTNKLGTYKGDKTLQLKPNATPVFCKPWSVPFAMRTKLEDELSRLQREDIIEPVQSADWATQ